MTDISPEAIETLAGRFEGAECEYGCGTMKFCICAYAGDCVDTLRALSAALAEARAENEMLRDALYPFGIAWGVALKTGITSMSHLSAMARNEIAGVHFQRARAALQDKPNDQG